MISTHFWTKKMDRFGLVWILYVHLWCNFWTRMFMFGYGIFRLREMTFFDLVMTLGLSFLLTSLECCFCSTTKWPSLLKLLKDTLPILSDYKRKNDYAHQNLILFDVLLVILRRRLPENQFRKRLENLFQTTVRIAKHTTRNDLNSYLKLSVPRSKLYSFFDAIFKMKLKDMCVINHIVINSN